MTTYHVTFVLANDEGIGMADLPCNPRYVMTAGSHLAAFDQQEQMPQIAAELAQATLDIGETAETFRAFARVGSAVYVDGDAYAMFVEVS